MNQSPFELETNANAILAEQGIPPPLKAFEKFFRLVCPGAEMITEERWIEVANSVQFYESLIIWWLWENWVSPTAGQRNAPGEHVLDQILLGARSGGVHHLRSGLLVGFFVSISESNFGTKFFGLQDDIIPMPESFFRKPSVFINMLYNIETEINRTSQSSPVIPSRANREIVYLLLDWFQGRGIDNQDLSDVSLGNSRPLVLHLIECHKLRWVPERLPNLVASIKGGDYRRFRYQVPQMMLVQRDAEEGFPEPQSEKEYFIQELEEISSDPSWLPSERFFRLASMAWDFPTS